MHPGVLGCRACPHLAIAEALASRVHRALQYAHRLLCSVTGHTLMLAFERHRLLLRCDHCGYESPGWEIGPPALRPLRPARRPGVAHSPRLPRAA
jgi:hypothetical protein